MKDFLDNYGVPLFGAMLIIIALIYGMKISQGIGIFMLSVGVLFILAGIFDVIVDYIPQRKHTRIAIKKEQVALFTRTAIKKEQVVLLNKSKEHY